MNDYNRPSPSDDERLMAMLIFASSIFTAIIGPLIIWLLKKDESQFIDYYGKEYFNFFISVAIYGTVAGILFIIFIGMILAPIVAIYSLVFTVIAAVKAYSGEYYQIPLIIRFIK